MCARGLRIVEQQHLMFTASTSNSRVRLSSTTNTQGLPLHRPTILPSQNSSIAHPCATRHRDILTNGRKGSNASSTSTLAALGLPVLRGTGTSLCIETCHECGGDVRIIASIEDQVVIRKILEHLDEKAATAVTARLPPCRAPPATGLFD